MANAIIVQGYKDLGLKSDPTKGYLANVNADVYRRYFRHVLPSQMTGAQLIDQFGKTTDRVTTVEPATVYRVRAAADHHIGENRRAR